MSETQTHAPEAWGGLAPRAWQAEALPVALDALRERSGGVIRAVMGAGKSVLMAEVVAHRLAELGPGRRIIVTAPTQRLVDQLAATVARRVGEANVGRYYQHAKQIERPVIVSCHPSLCVSDLVCPTCSVDTSPRASLEGDALAAARSAFQTAAVAEVEPLPCLDPYEHGHAHRVLLGGLARDLVSAGLIVDTWIGDEAHKSESPIVRAFTEWCRPEAVLGFTATPWRSSPRQRLELFAELVYDYGPSAAMRDGVVVPFELIHYDGPPPDPEDTQAVDRAAAAMIEYHLAAHPGPGVASAVSIEDAMDFAAYLNNRGVPSSAIHSRMKRAERDDVLGALRRGELLCVVHVALLVEGVDLPWLEWLCIRRPPPLDTSLTPTRIPQEIGRVLRAHPGKERAFVLDLFDTLGRFSIDYEAVVGGGPEDDSPKAELDRLLAAIRAALAEEGEGPGESSTRRHACMPAVLQWIRRLSLALKLRGYDELKTSSTEWRGEPPTDKQIDYLMGRARVAARVAEVSHGTRLACREACRMATSGALKRGDASDLITIFKAMIEHKGMPDLGKGGRRA